MYIDSIVNESTHEARAEGYITMGTMKFMVEQGKLNLFIKDPQAHTKRMLYFTEIGVEYGTGLRQSPLIKPYVRYLRIRLSDVLHHIEGQDFDLVLCDLAMPNVFGHDVVKALNWLKRWMDDEMR